MFKCLLVGFLFLVGGFFAGAFVGTQHPEWLNCCGCCPACLCPKACPAPAPVQKHRCHCADGKACRCTNCQCNNCGCELCPGKKGE